MADVYKVKRDVSIPRAVGDLGNGNYSNEGRNYPAGSYVLADDISPPVLERIENGDLDDLVEKASSEDAEAAKALSDGRKYGTFIAEHEVESYYLQKHGHTTVPRDQVIELRSAGAEAAAENIEAVKESGGDARDLPRYADEVPSLAEVSRGEHEAVVPTDAEAVEVPEGTEMPPGLPTGDTLAGAEGGAEAKEKAAKKQAKGKKSSSGSSSSSSSGGSNS